MTPAAIRNGRYRARTTRETIAAVDRLRGAFGITRLADITGLDRIGVPVFQAVRPNARSVSVSLGKGLDSDAARASALMEAAELAHAETLDLPTLFAATAQLPPDESPRTLNTWPRMRRRLSRGTRIHWVKARELATGKAAWVPRELVRIDCLDSGCADAAYFARSSNGLASGNVRAEAILAALCEVIERDALAQWQALPLEQRADTRLVLDKTGDARCRALVRRFAQRKIALAVWDATSDVAVPCFVARIADGADAPHAIAGSFWGAGCHPDPAIAFVRAVTEAAQSRLTLIAGARDDLERADYAEEPDAIGAALDRWEEAQAARRLGDIVPLRAATTAGAAAALVARLRGAGFDRIFVADLSRPGRAIAVVRAIVPGLKAAGAQVGMPEGARRSRARAA
ncbi:MAG TPA: YcaO-like family protein [Rhizomicrobium sp.]|nr:YcaO-like family protein [Rhizomicrobium sp.]